MRLGIALLLAPLMQGCYSYVKTYDGHGRMIAECNSGGMALGFIPVWDPITRCNGSANPVEQTANAIIEPWTPPKAPMKQDGCPEGKYYKNGFCFPENTVFQR